MPDKLYEYARQKIAAERGVTLPPLEAETPGEEDPATRPTNNNTASKRKPVVWDDIIQQIADEKGIVLPPRELANQPPPQDTTGGKALSIPEISRRAEIDGP